MHRARQVYANDADEASLISRHPALIDRVARRLALKVGAAHLADELWSAGALGLLELLRNVGLRIRGGTRYAGPGQVRATTLS